MALHALLEFQQLRERLAIAHCFSEANPFSDMGSRGDLAAMYQMAAQIGIRLRLCCLTRPTIVVHMMNKRPQTHEYNECAQAVPFDHGRTIRRLPQVLWTHLVPIVQMVGIHKAASSKECTRTQETGGSE